MFQSRRVNGAPGGKRRSLFSVSPEESDSLHIDVYLYALELSALGVGAYTYSYITSLKCDLFLQLTKVSLDPIQTGVLSPTHFGITLSHCT